MTVAEQLADLHRRVAAAERTLERIHEIERELGLNAPTVPTLLCGRPYAQGPHDYLRYTGSYSGDSHSKTHCPGRSR